MRILIIDKQSRACECLKDRLENWHQIGAFREAANVCEVLHLLEEIQPDIFLVDARMPVVTGLKAIRLIKAKFQAFLVIAISLNSDSKTEALAAGVDAFIGKSDSPERLMEVFANELWIKKSLERDRIKPFKRLPPKVCLQAPLSFSSIGKVTEEIPSRKK